jgi:ribosomal protein S18 acetylase RimI-like enzyme
MPTVNKPSQVATQDVLGKIALRPVLINQDENFLINLYFSTREDLDNLPLANEIKENILKMQYEAQKQQFESAFPNLEENIILLDQKMSGRLLVSRDKDVIHLVDIALLPQYRNFGVGTSLLLSLREEVVSGGQSIILHVLKNNPAVRLYQRLGFVITNEKEMHYQMTYESTGSKSQTNI